jgi:hypothetical protein
MPAAGQDRGSDVVGVDPVFHVAMWSRAPICDISFLPGRVVGVLTVAAVLGDEKSSPATVGGDSIGRRAVEDRPFLVSDTGSQCQS